ncbi:MAG: hypothetical protein ABJA93_14785, partial [Sporichthyaceae bacterium]
MMTRRHMPLRWRFILAFLAASVMPVLVASFLAASAIQSVFERNLEQWMSEAALFLLSEITETEEDAGKAASSVAAALRQRSFTNLEASEAARPFADLLNSVGYDFIKLYDETGNVAFSSPGIELDVANPDGKHEWVRGARIDGRPSMLVGAVRSFEANGRRQFVVVANALNESFFGTSNQHASLDVRVYPVVDRQPVYEAGGETSRKSILVSGKVLRKLMEKPQNGLVLDAGSDDITTAFVGIYGTDGTLIGIVACQLSGASAIFEELGQWGLFAGLA